MILMEPYVVVAYKIGFPSKQYLLKNLKLPEFFNQDLILPLVSALFSAFVL
jgi:hypothetical protein